ncbi:MAG: ribonuclease III [Actinomycetaceae bacterium]|nr:ribonuclease III [Actinomycetaceae bacterium]
MARRKRRKQEPAAPQSDVNQLWGRWRISLDPELAVTALTHRSFAFENGGLPHNERLEFLGDSVLSIIVTEKLFRTYPHVSEASLSRMRGAIVSERTLAQAARNLDLGSFILLGRGENLTGGRERDSILCDTFEALIGATYLSFGLETTRSIVEHHLNEPLLNAQELELSADYKTTLQEYCSQYELGEPVYTDEGFGPDHERVFVATVSVGDLVVGAGRASSKKQAKSLAAGVAYAALQANDADPVAANAQFLEDPAPAEDDA